MSLPSLEELILQRKSVKAEFKRIYKDHDIYKQMFATREEEIEEFIYEHFSMLEEDDQRLSYEIRQKSMVAFATGFAPLACLILYNYRYRPSYSWYIKAPVFLAAFTIPISFSISYISTNYYWLTLLLIRKYGPRVAEYNISPDPKVINRNL